MQGLGTCAAAGLGCSPLLLHAHELRCSHAAMRASCPLPVGHAAEVGFEEQAHAGIGVEVED
jgi:hypothetical protein